MASVDVVIPNYNYGRYLRQCVESVLAQNTDDIRILIIDNASTDNSVEIARELAKEYGCIEIIAREKNLGYHASINEGIDWASSDYVIALCSDDLLTPGSISYAVSYLEAHPDVSYVFGNYVSFTGDSLPEFGPAGHADAWRLWDSEEFIRHNCRDLILTVAPIVRNSAQKQVGHYRPELPYTDDLEMLLRLACFGPVAQTTRVLTAQRLHGVNISHATWNDPIRGLTDEEAMYDSFFAHEGGAIRDAKRLHRVAKRTIAKKAYRLALSYFVRGPRGRVLPLLKFAYARCPDFLLLPPLGYLFSYIFRKDRPFERLRRFLFGGGYRTQTDPKP